MADEGTICMGFVGAGANTRRRHIPGFRELSGVKLVSVANRSRESGERVAGEYEIPKVYDNWRDLIEADDTDAICIGTWPYMHRTITLLALENNKHVLTEARMAMDATDDSASLHHHLGCRCHWSTEACKLLPRILPIPRAQASIT